MRTALSLLLIGLVGTCPIVCGTAHAMTGDAGHGHAHSHRSALPAPANDDDCLCNGALKAAAADLAIDLCPTPLGLDTPFALATGMVYDAIPANPSLCGTIDPPSPIGVRGTARLPFLRC